MEAILKTVAREYAERYKDLRDVCFLFPNKRCGVFLKKYLAEFGKRGDEMPHILTISEFASQVAGLKEAGKIVQLFSLFNAYREVVGESVTLDFDEFRGWADTVLGDFSTVDFYMADPATVFKNVKDFREISADYLTDEQREVMREYFGVEYFGGSTGFWKHFEDPSKITPLKERFLNLWQVLAPLHEKFTEKLESTGFATAGMIYRRAAENLEETEGEKLPYNKIVAVGFNALTESERRIFKTLQSLEGKPGLDDYADFIWDATGPVLTNSRFNASKFVSYNRKKFPEPEWLNPVLEAKSVATYPEIRIISSPSLTAQAKLAGEALKHYHTPDERKMIADAEVALVLPDESLLSNILYSLPDDIGDINLTMGYSLRQTPIAAFMSLLRRLYNTTREDKSGGRVYYVKDLRMVLSHPYSYMLFGEEHIATVMDEFYRRHKIRISLEELKELLPGAEELLAFPNKEKGEIFPYLKKVLGRLLSVMAPEESVEGEEPAPVSEDYSQVKVYSEYVEELEEAVKQYKIESSGTSVMQMLDRIIANEKIGFEGEPLSGLQVMGTLETRSLDFRHVIILSMNEGVMPRKAVTSTFIPESLRRDYGLPPARYAEEIFAYYFFRLISRAEKVTLIYDGRVTTGMRGGESRYLLQLLEYVPEDRLSRESWQFRLQNREIRDASIEKTPEILELAEAFCREGDERKNFSASSLNTYRECQVKFLFQSLLNLNADPERSDYMDAIEVGDVLHDTMMDLYLPDERDQRKLLKEPVTMDSAKLQGILENRGRTREVVDDNIRKIYYGDRNMGKIESGVTEIIAEQIGELVEEIVKYDLGLAPFRLYGCEISRNMRVKLASGRVVNFRFAIDRLDEIEYEGRKRLRIVDYKTGMRKRKASSLEDMFEGGYESEQLFQLFVYAWLLGKLGVKGSEDVMTEIYFVPDLVKGRGGLPEIGGEKVTGYGENAEEFGERLERMVESVFEEGEFRECKERKRCGGCAFEGICNTPFGDKN